MREPFSVRKRLKSFTYAWKGIRFLLIEEHNARIHCVVICLVTGAGFFFDISKGEWIAVAGCCGMVLAAEAFNSAIERLVDLVSPDYLPLAGRVKDMAAGGVLICAVAAVVIGCIIFIPRLVEAS